MKNLIRTFSECRFKLENLPNYCSFSNNCQNIKCNKFGIAIDIDIVCDRETILVVCNNISKVLRVDELISFAFMGYKLHFSLTFLPSENILNFRIYKAILNYQSLITDVTIPNNISFMCSGRVINLSQQLNG
ncbi:hypothetical protein HZS_3050 [Henneguya salminicola]|nr:hypothetical protein HZS_3050 [Henneguya salminicola]